MARNRISPKIVQLVERLEPGGCRLLLDDRREGRRSRRRGHEMTRGQHERSTAFDDRWRVSEIEASFLLERFLTGDDIIETDSISTRCSTAALHVIGHPRDFYRVFAIKSNARSKETDVEERRMSSHLDFTPPSPGTFPPYTS